MTNTKRSLAAKKGAVTRAHNRRVAAERGLRLHQKIIGGGAIAVVIVVAFLGIRSELQSYAANVATGTLVGIAGKCLDNQVSRAVNENRIQLYACNGTAAQRWTQTTEGYLKSANGDGTYCLSVVMNRTAEYAYLQLYKCLGASGQKFSLSGNQIINSSTGFCATDQYASVENGTHIWMKACNGNDSQRWVYSGFLTHPPSGEKLSGIIPGVEYDQLAGATFGKRVSAAGATKTVGLNAATYSFANFVENNSGAYITSKGIVGQGRTKTIVQLKPNSMSVNAPVVQCSTGVSCTTNPYSMMRFTAAGTTIADMTIMGTDQGFISSGNRAKVYNGVAMSNITSPVIKNVKIVNVPGWDKQNPGETFSLTFNHATSPVVSDVEVDGGNVGASGIAPNSSSGGTYTNINVHNNKYSGGMAFWQQRNGATINGLRSAANRTGLNLERVTGTITVNNPVFSGNTSQDVFFGNDLAVGKLVLKYTLAPAAKVTVRIPSTEQGKPNKQTRGDVKLYVGGVDKTSTYVTFL